MRYVVQGSGLRAHGEVQAGGKRSRIVMKAANGNVVETRDDGPVYYLDPGGPSLHSVDPNIPRNARWIQGDADELRHGLDAGVRSFELRSPLQILQYVAALDPRVEMDGRERVNGVMATRYLVRIRTDKLLAQLGSTVQDVTTRAKLKDDQVGVVFWVDDHDLIQRSRIRHVHDHKPDITITNVTAYKRGLRVEIPRARSVYGPVMQRG